MAVVSLLAITAAVSVWQAPSGQAMPAKTQNAPAKAQNAPAKAQNAPFDADARNAPEDAFYLPPNPLPEGRPGDVIRSRPSKATVVRGSGGAWQVMYLSTDALGNPMAVTGTVLLPQGVDLASAPIVGFAPGTHGPAYRCAPSHMLDIGAFYEQPAVNDLLAAGYAVAVTDYEGYRPTPSTTYAVGRSEGAAVIDAVRAAQRLPGGGLSPAAKVVFRGYSQGGGAALWAGRSQPAYAPELRLVGVVGGGVPAGLTALAPGMDGAKASGLLFSSLIGLDRAYPDLRLRDYLTDAGAAAFADIERDACTLELLTTWSGKKLADYTTADPLRSPSWQARAEENRLGGAPLPVPVYQYHAEQDDLAPVARARALRADLCARGVAVRYREYRSDHFTLVYTGNRDALAWMTERFAERPATSNCTG
ncbi:Secretory lipase [Actinokineospora iranica]|uniref:Secretory lipase n=1 Tax=Actinokineospora iranica TaxID=1271860 RepID=A0A1G6YSN7_9PSEU|nr:Secretory lipase [Actinokineospora iranica]